MGAPSHDPRAPSAGLPTAASGGDGPQTSRLRREQGIRLSRDHHFGPGVVVIEGIADDSGAVRWFYAELTERDYDEAIRAHSLGLRVVTRGDLITRGSYKWLRPTRSFAIIPGLE